MHPVDLVSRADFQAGFEKLLGQLPSGVIHSVEFIDLASDQAPWFDTGIELTEGEQVTGFTIGKTQLKGTDLSFGADFQLWYRIGVDGVIFRGTRCSHSFKVENSGRLCLASYFPGEWASRTGEVATHRRCTNRQKEYLQCS